MVGCVAPLRPPTIASLLPCVPPPLPPFPTFPLPPPPPLPLPSPLLEWFPRLVSRTVLSLSCIHLSTCLSIHPPTTYPPSYASSTFATTCCFFPLPHLPINTLIISTFPTFSSMPTTPISSPFPSHQCSDYSSLVKILLIFSSNHQGRRCSCLIFTHLFPSMFSTLLLSFVGDTHENSLLRRLFYCSPSCLRVHVKDTHSKIHTEVYNLARQTKQCKIIIVTMVQAARFILLENSSRCLKIKENLYRRTVNDHRENMCTSPLLISLWLRRSDERGAEFKKRN